MTNRPLDKFVHGFSTMLVVADVDKSVKFYRDKLGFSVIWRESHIATVALGTILLDLFLAESEDSQNLIKAMHLNTPDKTNVILDFHVVDCRAAYEELLKRGVQFFRPPHTPPWGGWRCFAVDPDGYMIELEENPNRFEEDQVLKPSGAG